MTDYSIHITVKQKNLPSSDKYYGFTVLEAAVDKYMELVGFRNKNKPIVIPGLGEWDIVGPVKLILEE